MKTKILIAASALFIFYSCNSNTDNSADSTTATTMDHTTDMDTASHTIMPDTAITSPVNEMDKEFVMKASMGNMAEAEAGKMATDKGVNAGVKDFGSMMAMDHSDAQRKLKEIAASLSLMTADSINAAQKMAQKKLESLSGTKFDTEYINGQIKDHKETIALFEKEISSGSNTQIKSFAAATLPTIKMHLEKVMALKK